MPLIAEGFAEWVFTTVITGFAVVIVGGGIMGALTDGGGGGFFMFFLAPILGVIYLVFWRFICEMWLLMFLMYNRMGEIRDRLPPR